MRARQRRQPSWRTSWTSRSPPRSRWSVKRGTVEVTDRSSSEWLDLETRYTNLDGQPVEVTYEGKVPLTRRRRWSSPPAG